MIVRYIRFWIVFFLWKTSITCNILIQFSVRRSELTSSWTNLRAVRLSANKNSDLKQNLGQKQEKLKSVVLFCITSSFLWDIFSSCALGVWWMQTLFSDRKEKKQARQKGRAFSIKLHLRAFWSSTRTITSSQVVPSNVNYTNFCKHQLTWCIP